MRLFLLLLLLAQSSPDFRSEVALVQVDVEVVRGGVPVDGLQAADFVAADNGKPQPIVHFLHGEERLDIVLLFDTSDSMERAVRRAGESITAALRELRAGDRVAVMTVHCDAELVVDFLDNFGAVASVVRDLADARFSSCSKLQLGLAQAAGHFRRGDPRAARRAVVVLTDDWGSERHGRALAELWAADAVALGVIVPQNSPNKPKPGSSRYSGIQEIAERTGGDSLLTADAGQGLIERIHRLRARYSLSYKQPEAKAGSQRRIQVRLSPEAARRYPGAVVRARGGYVAVGR